MATTPCTGHAAENERDEWMADNSARLDFEGWLSRDSTLPATRHEDTYEDFTVALMWHTWKAARAALLARSAQRGVQSAALVEVTPEGVQFGGAWFSHERITGVSADDLESGNCALRHRKYMEWVRSQRDHIEDTLDMVQSVESLPWITDGSIPDAEELVLVEIEGDCVWPGSFDGQHWIDADGLPIENEKVVSWAHMPAGTKGGGA